MEFTSLRKARRRYDTSNQRRDERHHSPVRYHYRDGLSKHYNYRKQIADRRNLEQSIQSAVRREILDDRFLHRVASYAKQHESSRDKTPPPHPLQSGGYKSHGDRVAKEHMCIHANFPTKIRTPSRVVVAGVSMSGKSTWTKELLKRRNQVFDPQPQEILWFYKVASSVEPFKKELPGVQFFQGLPELSSIQEMDSSVPKVIVIDDQQKAVDDKSDIINSLFTVDSHHSQITIIFIVQNIFLNAKQMRSTVENANYVVYFKGGRSAQKTTTIASQIWGWEGTASFMNWVRNIAFSTEKVDFPYLMFDMHNKTPAWAQLKTNVFPGECNTFYIKKGTSLDGSFDQLKQAEVGADKDA